MPRYHFNVYDGKSTLDQEGTELNSIEEARFAAVCLAGRIISKTSSTFARAMSGASRSRMKMGFC